MREGDVLVNAALRECTLESQDVIYELRAICRIHVEYAHRGGTRWWAGCAISCICDVYIYGDVLACGARYPQKAKFEYARRVIPLRARHIIAAGYDL